MGAPSGMEPWHLYREGFGGRVGALEATDRSGHALELDTAFGTWVDLTRQVHQHGRSVFFIGNGGSAMIASHMATDACKNAGLRALAFNDPSLLTATGNDLSFDQVFSLPLSRLATKSDLLISISSSGNSPNIVRALETGRQLGLHLVTLSGMGADNTSRMLGDVNFYIPAPTYGWVECAHQLVIHYWFDTYMQRFPGGAN